MASIVKRRNRFNVVYLYTDANGNRKQKWETFKTIEKAKAKGLAEITVNLLGVRPCEEGVDEEHLQRMLQRALKISEKYSGIPCKGVSGSTDCNIPMSMGIPSIAIGCCYERGAHTRDERVLISSIPKGMKIAAEVILGYFNI